MDIERKINIISQLKYGNNYLKNKKMHKLLGKSEVPAILFKIFLLKLFYLYCSFIYIYIYIQNANEILKIQQKI